MSSKQDRSEIIQELSEEDRLFITERASNVHNFGLWAIAASSGLNISFLLRLPDPYDPSKAIITQLIIMICFLSIFWAIAPLFKLSKILKQRELLIDQYRLTPLQFGKEMLGYIVIALILFVIILLVRIV